MNSVLQWRLRARVALERYFRNRSMPRLVLSGLLLVTGAFGFLTSYLLLRFGVVQMWLRYPVAVLSAYLIFLGQLRIWVEIERRRFEPQSAGLPDEALEPEPGHHGRGSIPPDPPREGRSTWDWLDVSDFGNLDFDEGCLPVILIGLIAGIFAVIFTVVVNAPILLAEVFLDAVLVSALYRRLNFAARNHWLGTAVRRTWISALITAVSLSLAGLSLSALAPGSHSVGRALKQILHRSPHLDAGTSKAS